MGIDLKKEIRENEVIIAVCGEHYKETLMDIVKQASKLFRNMCFVSLNKPYFNLVSLFKKSRINPGKILFIDAITKTVVKPEPAKNAVFISAPNALTEMNIAITKAIKSSALEFLLFDSVSSLMVYEKGSVALEFIHSVVNGLRVHKTRAVFMILKSDIDTPLMKDMDMFADRIIKI